MEQNQNNKQDISIAKLETNFRNLKESFDKFISNDFQHLSADVKDIKNKLFYGFLIGISAMVVSNIVLKFLE